jgi:hypothetical protein
MVSTYSISYVFDKLELQTQRERMSRRAREEKFAVRRKKQPQMEHGGNTEMKILSLFFIRVESVFHQWLMFCG